MKWSGVRRRGEGRGGVEWSGVERRGVEWSGVEWGGEERGEVEWSEAERRENYVGVFKRKASQNCSTGIAPSWSSAL